MMKFALGSAATLSLFASKVLAGGWPDLKHEHAGSLFQQVHGYHHCEDDEGVIHDGTPAGINVSVDGETLYLAYPHSRKTDYAILYLTDIFGLQLINNRLLADSLAKAGYFVVLPDLFRGDPVPADGLSDPNSTFDFPAWQARHPLSQTETIINKTLSAMRDNFNSSHIASTGYCFGGRFVARYLAAGRGLEAGFAAHPSGTTAEEWGAVGQPISLAFGELDQENTPANRSNIEGIFSGGNKTFQTSLYSQAEHGFAVRTNLSVPQKAFAQEAAYWQAVRWFDAWVKGDY